MLLPIQNHSLNPVNLQGDQLLGRTNPDITLVPASEASTPDECCHNQQVKLFSPYRQEKSRTNEILNVLGIESLHLTPTDMSQLSEVVGNFTNIFALNDSELGCTHVVKHSINTGEQPPIRQHPRRIPFALRSKVDEMVDEMLERGVIQHSHSPWASPIVLVAKKDGTMRFCVDYRRLNAASKKDVHPLPRIDETLGSLANHQYFSTLDLASGYWQVGMDDTSQEKTTFITHSGLYEFRVMAFGLCNAPSTFQRLMEVVLGGLVRESCFVYLDDIVVVGRTFDEHLTNLTKVFSRLREAGLHLKPTKCHLARTEVKYLGHVVSRQGVSADPEKVEAVRKYPQPIEFMIFPRISFVLQTIIFQGSGAFTFPHSQGCTL